MMHHTQKVLEAFFLHGAWRLSGHVIELGVGQGKTTAYLAEAVARIIPLARFYACDTFNGFPHTEGKLVKGKLATGRRQVEDHIAAHPWNEYKPRVTLLEGLIEETLPTIEDPYGVHDKFRFAWVDLDLEKPTRFAIKWLEDRMVPGGIIGFHDYGFFNTPGIKPAVDQTLNWAKYDKVNIDAINTLFVRKKL